MTTRQEYQDELMVLRTRNAQLEERVEQLRQEALAKHMRAEYLQEVLQRGGIKGNDYAIARAAENFVNLGLDKTMLAAGIRKPKGNEELALVIEHQQALITLMETVHPDKPEKTT